MSRGKIENSKNDIPVLLSFLCLLFSIIFGFPVPDTIGHNGHSFASNKGQNIVSEFSVCPDTGPGDIVRASCASTVYSLIGILLFPPV